MTDPEPSPSQTSPPETGLRYDRFLDCVHCGLCTSACPTYLETGDENDSPRGRIYLMRQVVDGNLPLSEPIQQHLDLCLDCRSCETACPSGVEYGRLIEPFRVAQKRDHGDGSGLIARLLLRHLFPYPRRMRLALAPARLARATGMEALAERVGLTRLLPSFVNRMRSLLPGRVPKRQPLPEVLSPIGEHRATVALFTGCVADTLFSHVNAATARVLQANGCEVHIPRKQVCCGAIHYHAGTAEPAMRFGEHNVGVFDDDRFDEVIVNVAGCGAMLKDYGEIIREIDSAEGERTERFDRFAGRVRDVSEFLHELGLRPPAGRLPLRVCYHDACHLAHAQGIRTEPRSLLKAIPDLTLVPLEESDICCGAAGSYNLTQPEMSDRLSDRKRSHILDTGAVGVVTGNAGCAMQLRRGFASLPATDRPVPWVAHPIELLDLSYREQPIPDDFGL